MPRTTKKTATIEPDLINIADFCQSQGISEQIFRLELMQHCENADSLKYITPDVASSVAISLTTTQPALPQTTQEPENLTPQSFEPSQELASEQPQKQQNSSIAASTPKAVSTTATGSQVPTALQELIKSAEETIELADLVQVYRNEQILSNADARDSELVVKLRERRIETRNQVFDSLRDLNGKQPIPQELPELPPNLKEEIKSLSNELGKQLSA